MTRGPLFRKVSIIGVGLIGGSLGMAIKKRKLAHEVHGFSQSQSTLGQALKLQALDRVSTDIRHVVAQADIVIVATPVKTIVSLLEAIDKHVRRGCVVTDVGSSKAYIVDAAQKLSNPPFFVGGHPLAGSERKGVAHGHADLFENSECILTPTAVTHKVALDRVRQLWTAVGARVKEMDPGQHDEALAFISHLPHLAAFGLINALPQELVHMAPQGLKDTTRIASSSPEMWSDIALTNVKPVLKALDEYVRALSSIRKAIIDEDAKNLIEIFKKAKTRRDGLVKS